MPAKKFPAQSQSMTLEWSKSTKRTEVFTAIDEDAAIQTVYIQRSAFSGDVPDAIALTLEW